jgi:hypothetical protein
MCMHIFSRILNCDTISWWLIWHNMIQIISISASIIMLYITPLQFKQSLPSGKRWEITLESLLAGYSHFYYMCACVFGLLTNASVSWSAIQSTSCSVGWSVSWSLGRTSSHSVGWSVIKSFADPLVGWSIGYWASQVVSCWSSSPLVV